MKFNKKDKEEVIVYEISDNFFRDAGINEFHNECFGRK